MKEEGGFAEKEANLIQNLYNKIYYGEKVLFLTALNRGNDKNQIIRRPTGEKLCALKM